MVLIGVIRHVCGQCSALEFCHLSTLHAQCGCGDSEISAHPPTAPLPCTQVWTHTGTRPLLPKPEDLE